MTESGGSMEASMVFEKLLTDFLKSQTDDAARALLIRKLERLKQERELLGGINVNDDGTVSINIREGSEFQVVSELSNAFDSLLDVLAFLAGREAAFRQAEAVVSAVMKQFREPFSRLGVNNHILKGYMAERIPSGVDGLDSILGGGFPRSDMILLTGPPGMAKYALAFQFLAHGLRRGGSGIAAISSMNVKETRGMLSKLGVNVSSCETRGRLKIIDWYSQKSRPVIGIEEHGALQVASKDIANLDIAFAGAMDRLAFSPATRAFVDIVTTALNIYELSDVVEFVQRQKSRLGGRGIPSIFIVEDGVHDVRVMATLKHTSDTVLAITVDDQGKLFIEVEEMSASNFRRGKSAVQLSYKGISVKEAALDEGRILSDFCSIPLVTREVAQKLIDAGFTDMNQLSRAEETELLGIGSITREIARSIAEYTRTVEYSQSVLSTRSDKWLRKAKEQEASGDLRKAKGSLERALEIDPANAIAHAELSRLKDKLGDGGS